MFPAEGEVVRACFGDRCLDARVITFAATSEPTISLAVAADALRAQPFDYSALLRVFRSPTENAAKPTPGTPRGLLFTGYVEHVEGDGPEWRIDAAARVDPTRSRLAATFFKLSHAEQFWSIGRIAGVLPDALHINDADWPPPSEQWLVVMPLRGVRPAQALRFGDVVITDEARLGLIFEDAPAALRNLFRSTSVWAMVPVQTAMAFDAETEGVRRLRHAVDRLALLARYSASITPSGQLRPFHLGLVERIALVPVVGAQTTGTGRKWLRELNLIPEPVELDDRSIAGLEQAAAAQDRQLDLAVSAWRRATEDPDPSSAVVALAEALEFYVANTPVDAARPFGALDRKKLLERIASDWEDAQMARLQWLIAKLNEPSFGMLLATALAKDGVLVMPEEEQLLREIRAIRNDVVHGRARPLLTPDQHRRALALVGRILTFRGHGREADGQKK